MRVSISAKANIDARAAVFTQMIERDAATTENSRAMGDRGARLCPNRNIPARWPLGHVVMVEEDRMTDDGMRSADQLLMRMAGELGYFDTKLVCVAPDLFRAPPTNQHAVQNQPLIFFDRDAGGAIRAILYSTDRTKNLRFERV